MTYPGWKRFIRKFISFLTALIVMAISFSIIIGAKYSQEILLEDFNTNIDCSYISYTETQLQEEFLDTQIDKKDKIFSFCFCYDSLFENGYSYTNEITIGGQLACQDWVSKYITVNALNAGIIILVPFTNSLIQIVLRFLTSFEKNKTLTEDMVSNMWKIFVLQFINTGLIILLVNVRIDSIFDTIKDFPVFTGHYKDFDPSWYNGVGATIVNLSNKYFSCFL